MNKKLFLKISQAYDHIIFDYGGIFVDIDYKRTIEELAKLSEGVSVEELYSKHNQIHLFSDLEIGKIGEGEFLDGLRELLKTKASDQELKASWCAMLGNVKQERIDFLKELAETKNIYMLSNINIIHENFLSEYPNTKELYQLFHKVYFSHHIGMRKPNAEVFEYVLNDQKIHASQTLFLDDSLQHIEGANALGIKAVHLEIPNSFIVS